MTNGITSGTAVFKRDNVSMATCRRQKHKKGGPNWARPFFGILRSTRKARMGNTEQEKQIG